MSGDGVVRFALAVYSTRFRPADRPTAGMSLSRGSVRVSQYVVSAPQNADEGERDVVVGQGDDGWPECFAPQKGEARLCVADGYGRMSQAFWNQGRLVKQAAACRRNVRSREGCVSCKVIVPTVLCCHHESETPRL
jgi:hypothetical protein